jgi:5'-nucleotidase
VARRASKVKSIIESAQQYLILDCGNFGGSKSPEQTLKVEYLLKSMAMLRYDAINLAEKDLQYGVDFLNDMQSKYFLPFISANVVLSGTDSLFARPYIIKQKGNINIGVFGITAVKRSNQLVLAGSGFDIIDPLPAARKMVQTLQNRCDVIVAMSHLGLDGSRKLARDIAGIDIIISGSGWQTTHEPMQVGGAVVIQPGYKGKYLGHLKLSWSGTEVKDVDGEIIALNDDVPDDKEFVHLVKEYDQNAKKLATGY